jgi:hypothetical protein
MEHPLSKPLNKPEAPRRLQSEIRPPEDLSLAERERMFALFGGYYNKVCENTFYADLAEKDSCILLMDAASTEIHGFSTLTQIQTHLDGEPLVAIFSGDTIIDRDYWGSTELVRAWGRHVFRLADEFDGGRAFWFLISSGYKTYRFLPVFFRQFYPSHNGPTPTQAKALLDQLAQLKFSDKYDAARGVIRLDNPTPLRDGIADITPARLKDPYVSFFVDRNPGHVVGEQLACLTELTRDNLTAAGRRMLDL